MHQCLRDLPFDHFISEGPFAIVKAICFGEFILYDPEVVVLFQTGSAYRTFVGDIGVTGQAVCHRDGV